MARVIGWHHYADRNRYHANNSRELNTYEICIFKDLSAGCEFISEFRDNPDLNNSCLLCSADMPLIGDEDSQILPVAP
jgi:hypothetical protein